MEISKSKVLLMIDWPPENGSSLADELRKNSIDCDVTGIDFKLETWTPIGKIFFHWTKCFVVAIKAFKKRKQYDYILARQQLTGIFFGLLKKITFSKNSKLAILVTNVMERRNPINAWFRRQIFKLGWSGADIVAFKTERLLTTISRSYGLPAGKAVHLPFAYNIDKYPHRGAVESR